jgi:FG-GAP-like repeat
LAPLPCLGGGVHVDARTPSRSASTRDATTSRIFFAAFQPENGAQVSSTASVGNIPTNWDVVGTSDFDGDGKSDIAWRDLNSGNVAIWLMNGAAIKSSGGLGSVPLNWLILGTGDYNGDGKSDLYVVRHQQQQYGDLVHERHDGRIVRDYRQRSELDDYRLTCLEQPRPGLLRVERRLAIAGYRP